MKLDKKHKQDLWLLFYYYLGTFTFSFFFFFSDKTGRVIDIFMRFFVLLLGGIVVYNIFISLKEYYQYKKSESLEDWSYALRIKKWIRKTL